MLRKLKVKSEKLKVKRKASHRFCVLCFVFCILCFVNSYSQPAGFKAMKDTAAFKTKFTEVSKNTSSIEADFTQEKYISVMTEKSITKGRMLFKKENKMLWEHTQPAGYSIALNAGKMYIKEKGKVKSYDTQSNKMFKGLNDMMLSTVNGTMLSNKDYSYKLFENTQYYLVELYPKQKQMKGYMKQIDLYLDKKDYSVSRIVMTEPSGDYTNMEFTNKKFNQAVNEERFVLK